MRVGIDFDNTIITYDSIFAAAARERRLISDDFRSASKQSVRNSIRALPHGELAWQQLQGHVYGQGIVDAVMFEGVDHFFRRCRTIGCSVVIVSHKTKYGHHDSTHLNLRQAALDWMSSNGFFDQTGFGIPKKHVYFESTRAEKLARIADLNCTYFIDDLEEVLTDPAFPSQVRRILFAPAPGSREGEGYETCRTWHEVEKHIFRD